MSLFDLKPLSEATIQELGLDPHELWYVKIGDQAFGPFETLSLRHYANDNKKDFDGSFATHMGEQDWKLFTQIAEFRDIFDEDVQEEDPEKVTQYWILIQGRLSSPHSYEVIEKKLEMGLLSLTDAVSKDEGETWNKFFQMPDFAHKLHSSLELPQCPKDSQFQAAKIKVLEMMESKAENAANENLPGLAFLGQKTTQIVVLKLDEIDIKTLQETEISRSMKWVIPSAAVGMLALVMSGFFFFGEAEETYLITDSDVQVKRSISGSRSGLIQEPSTTRRPSSVRTFRSQRSAVTRNRYQESSYPTHIETHQEPDERDRDPQHEAAFDQEPTAPQTEESLVQNTDQTLDAAMNGEREGQEPLLEQPQVEEVSDF